MYKKVLAYLALLLGIAEVVVILVSWLLTAAMPESFTHSLTSPEGIRWFTGHFVDHITSVSVSYTHLTLPTTPYV